MYKALGSFAVQECSCVIEVDRGLVSKGHITLMKSAEYVQCDSSEDLALQVFDSLIRSDCRRPWMLRLACALRYSM